ncbi:MAG TPA: FHA domain-containing protein, partial [Elusimicrobiota bacterium]|nr:FHA domain-containing protein [Elusimicrobiota bacterium]
KINYDPIYDRDLLERSKAIQTWALNQENYGLIRGFSGEIDGPRSGQHSGRTWWAAVPLAAKDKIVEALKAGNLADPDVNRYLSHNVRRYLASPKGQIWVTTLHDLVSQNPLESVEQDSLGDLVAHFTETNMPLNGVHAFSLEWNPGFELDFQRNIHPETGYDEVFPKDFDFFQWRLTRHISEALHRDLPGDLQKTAGEHTVAVFLNEDKTAVERVVVGSTQFGWRFSPETNAMVLPGDESHPDGRASVEEVQHRMIQLNVRTDETGRWQTERVRGFFNDLQLANHLLNRSGRVTNEGPATEESGPLVVSTVQPLPLMVVHQMGLPVGEFVPEKFVAELMNDRELGRIFLMGTETDEGHRLYQHTAMVLRQFERYFAASPRFQAALTKAGVDLGFFRLFMALHDIGKPEARAGRVGENEFDHTSRLIRRYFERHGLSSKQLDLALSLAGGDPIGQYLRANPPTSTEFLSARDPLFIALAQGTEPSPLAYKAAAEISANARRLELDVETYWELLTAYYQSDAGAYTTDAYYAENGRLNYGPTSLNALFDFTRTDGSFISPPWQLKMEPLQRLVLGVTPPTTTPPAALPEITGPTLLTPESGPHRLPQFPSRLLLANVHPVSLRIDHGNLVATGPDGSTAVLQPGQTLSIGRSPDENSVGLVIKAQDVKNVSRRHATVQWDGQTALVADLSPNGTYVKPGDPLGDEFDAKLRAALQSEIPAVMDGQTVKVNLSVYTNGEAARVFREDEAIPARDLQGFEPHEITVFARSADGHTVDATIGRVRDGLGSKIQTLQSLAVGQVRPLDFSAEFGTVGAAFSRVTEDVATALAALAKPRGRADIENIVYSLGANAETLLTNQTTRRPIPYNLEYFSALINAWRNVQETVLLGGQSKFPKLSMSVPQKNLPFPIVAKDTHLVVESVANGKITLLLPSGERLTGSTIEFGRGNLGLGAVSGISAKHFTLSLVGSDVVILDNDSTNGTLVPSSTVAPRGPPAATISGLVPLIGRLYGLNPANPVDLNRIVNEKAPLVETVVTGAFYYAAVGLLSALGSAVGLHIDHAFFAATGLFALVNLAFGFSHRSVYRFKPPVPGVNRLGRWEAEPAPASRRERWGLALRGAAIHAPLLLAFMDPLGGLFLAPIAALTSVGLHAVHNRLAAERGWSALTAGGVDQKTTPPTADLVYMRSNTDRRRVDLAMDGLGYTTDLHYLLAFHQGTIPEGSQPNPEETESLEREFAVAQALTQLLGYDSLAELLVANGEKKIDIRPEPVLRYPTSRELILDILTRQGVPEPARREVTSRVDAESARGVLDRLADFLGYEAVKTQTKDGEKVTPARQGLIGDLHLNLAFHRPRTDPLKVSDQRDFLPPFLKRYRLPAVAEFTLPRLGEVRKPGGKLQPFENQFTLGPRGVEKRERTDSLLTAPLLGAAWVGQGNLAVKVWLSGGVLHAQRFKHTDNQLTVLDAQPIVVARALFEKGIDPTESLGLGSELFFTEKGVGLTSPDTATEGGLVALRVLAGPNDTLQIGLQYDAVNNRPTTVSGFPEAAFAAAPSLPGVLKADRGTVTAVALAAERDQKLAALAEGRKVRQALIEKSFEEAQSRENPGKWSLGLSAEDFAASYDGTDADIPAAVRAAVKERVGQERDRRAAREKLWDAEAAKALATAFQGSSLPLTADRKAGFTAKKADWTAS